MPKQPTGGHDDGSWFLEAVGATPASPKGAEALSELTKENEAVTPEDTESQPPSTSSEASPQPTTTDGVPVVESTAETSRLTKTTQVTFSSFDGDPGTANSTFATPRGGQPVVGSPKPTKTQPVSRVVPVAAAGAATAVIAPPPPDQDAVAKPSTATPADEPGSSKPEVDPELSKQVRSNRSFRWPIVAVLGLLLIAVVVGAFWLPRATEAEAITVRQSYYDASAAVRNQLPASQASLDVITNPTSTNDQLNGSIPAIAQLDTLAFGMQDVAAEPLPTVIPFLPRGAIDELEPLQETTALLGEDGDAIAKRLGNAYIYRISIPVLMSPGNLPISASTETINTISVTLAASLADDSAVVSELPDDPTFAAVHTEALNSHERYAEWQTEYLAALTAEDPDAAQDLVDELNNMRTALDDSNDAALASFRTEMDGRIVSYAVELETHMAELTQN